MTTTGQDVTMWSGDDIALVVTVTTDGTTAVDITAYTINYVLQNAVDQYTQRVSKATGGSGITITDAINGEFTVTLADTDTSTYSGTYYHEAQVTDGSGNKYTVMTGTVTIKKDVIA
jgi:hypothetical protein